MFSRDYVLNKLILRQIWAENHTFLNVELRLRLSQIPVCKNVSLLRRENRLIVGQRIMAQCVSPRYCIDHRAVNILQRMICVSNQLNTTCTSGIISSITRNQLPQISLFHLVHASPSMTRCATRACLPKGRISHHCSEAPTWFSFVALSVERSVACSTS